MEVIFVQLGILLFMAFACSYLAKMFKQPIIIGYIVSGIVIASILELGFIDISSSTELIHTFSQFGIAFLLFIVGLHMNPKVIKEIGGSSLVIGLLQMALTFVGGFLVAGGILGFDLVAAIYIGIALAFSSTIIIMKLLSDKKHLDSLYGKISVGVLIIQDLAAIAVLIVISSVSGAEFNLTSFAIKSLLGGIGLIVVLFLIGYFVLPYFIKGVARSQELLFLFSIFWCFAIAALFSYLGFSMEIGALLAGVVLSLSPYSTEISSKIRPLRDFFLVIFFVILGLNIHLSEIGKVFFDAVVLSIFVLIMKPLIVMSIMRFRGYTKRTNFLTGTTLAQISEFSLIVLSLGVSVGHISSNVLSTITLTAVLTITLSSYLIMYSSRIYERISSTLNIFELGHIKRQRKVKEDYNAVLFGYNRIGFGILNALKSIRKKYLVVDFNPDTISALQKLEIPALYGDADDAELLEELPLEKIEIAISTIPDYDANVLLIEKIRKINPKTVIIVRANRIDDAIQFYKKGASYVLTPHFLGGEYVANMIRDLKSKKSGYDKEKEKHIRNLTNIMVQAKRNPSSIE